MTAKGKINASKVQINDRIIVAPSLAEGRVNISQTKTGEGVHVARVTGKSYTPGSARRPGFYTVVTSSGTFTAAPIETMWLAPEDAAGIKRAHVEALKINSDLDDLWGIETAHAEALVEDQRREDSKRYARDLAGHVARRSGRTDLPKSRPMTDDEKEIVFPTSVDERGTSVSTAHQVLEREAPVTTENHTGSAVVLTLEKVWARIREDHPELPEVVIITGSGLVGASKWGHFRAEGWKVKEEGAAVRKHELFLAGEALAKGARQVLQTMLHEGAHTLAKVRGQQDTSRQGRWHNGTFRKLAEEMGLEHKGTKADSAHGFSFVTLTAETTERYADLLAELDKEIRLVCHLPLWLGGETDEDDKGGEKITGKPPTGEDEGAAKSGNLKATCGCAEPLIIRLSRKVLDLRVVRCDTCEDLFTAA